MKPSPKPKQDAKQLLLEAAQKLFVQKGYQAVSTRDIAHAARVNLGSIQYHFGSKARLFMDTVHSLMEGAGCARAQLPLEGDLTCPEEAAVRLGEFINELLHYFLLYKGLHPCRLMHREVLTATEENSDITETITVAYVRDFISPVDHLLRRLIGVLAPNESDRQREHISQSIVGQCTFYVTHGPFLEKLRDRKLGNEKTVRELANHIAEFSLRGMGCSVDLIRLAVLKNESSGSQSEQLCL